MSAFDFFDDIWCIHHPEYPARWPVMQSRFARLGIERRVRHFALVPSPADERIGRELSHRRIVQDAAERSLRSVLVIEDETLFLDRSDAVLAHAAAELRPLPRGRQTLLHVVRKFVASLRLEVARTGCTVLQVDDHTRYCAII
jgi:hypothetical protein